MKSNLTHALIRILGIPVLYMLIFFILTEGSLDNLTQAYGYFYAVFPTLLIAVLFLGIEAYRMRKTKKTKAQINMGILVLTLIVLLCFLIPAMY